MQRSFKILTFFWGRTMNHYGLWKLPFVWGYLDLRGCSFYKNILGDNNTFLDRDSLSSNNWEVSNNVFDVDYENIMSFNPDIIIINHVYQALFLLELKDRGLLRKDIKCVFFNCMAFLPYPYSFTKQDILSIDDLVGGNYANLDKNLEIDFLSSYRNPKCNFLWKPILDCTEFLRASYSNLPVVVCNDWEVLKDRNSQSLLHELSKFFEVRFFGHPNVDINGVTNYGFTDDFEKLDAWLGEAFAYVYTKKVSTLSMGVLEAMAHGVPCIVPSMFGQERFIKSGCNGFLYNNRDEALRFIFELTDKGLWDRISSNSLDTIYKSCSPEIEGNRWVSYLNSIVTGGVL